MRKVVLATRSQGKRAEFATLLDPLGLTIVLPDEIGLPVQAGEQDLECHDTFEANARAKARWFAAQSGTAALADDSGLEVLALQGIPGVKSKRFAGLDGPDHEVTTANNARLVERLKGVPDSQRQARYRCVLVLTPPPTLTGEVSWLPDEIIVEGTTTGTILPVERGSGGFGYDPLFYSDDLGQSFGEASAAQKHSVSHRGRAVAALAAALSRLDWSPDGA